MIRRYCLNAGKVVVKILSNTTNYKENKEMEDTKTDNVELTNDEKLPLLKSNLKRVKQDLCEANSNYAQAKTAFYRAKAKVVELKHAYQSLDYQIAEIEKLTIVTPHTPATRKIRKSTMSFSKKQILELAAQLGIEVDEDNIR